MTKPVMVPLIIAASLACFAQSAPRRVAKAEALKAVVSKVNPDYPTMAKQLHVQGTVELEAVVAETGAVEDVKIVSGNPILTSPSATALKQWKFTPFTSEGKAVKALAPVSFNFRLEK